MSADQILPMESTKRFQALVTAYEADKKQVVPVKDKMEAILREHVGARSKHLYSWQVVPHFENRDGAILSASGVELRAERVMNVGFSKLTFEKNAWCIEENPITKEITEKALAHLRKDPRFAEYKASNVAVGSVGASHMTHVIESARQELPCTNKAISKDSVWSHALWYPQGEGEFGDVATNGSMWMEIRWEIAAEFPQVAKIFQSALNTEQQVGDGEYTVT